MIIKGYLFSFLYGILCLTLAAVLYKFGVKKNVTRKIVHMLVGFEWVILYIFVGPSIHFLVVCIAFLLLLITTYKSKLMSMISSDNDNGPGTVYYALAMSVMASITLFVHEMILPFGIGVFCTSLGDGAAGLVGQGLPRRINPKIFGNKTLFGAVVNFAVCLSVALLFSHYFDMGIGMLGCILIALLSLELELFSVKGLDNITITLGTSLLAYALIYYGDIWGYILPILLTPMIIAFVCKKDVLSLGGIACAVLLDIIISVALGNLGFLILLTFLVGGVATDKIKKRFVKSGQKEKNASDSRNYKQVLANGAVGAVFAVIYLITDDKAFLVGFAASYAEALADTAASGIGALSDKAYDPFRMKKCTPGLSGGMSLIGTAASLLGAILVSLLTFAFGMVNIGEALIVGIAGFCGAVFDSFLGSLLQVKYKCTACGSIVEKRRHCGADTVYYRGVKFIGNSAVNFLSTAMAALLAAFCASFIIEL